jgi:2Fe-2S ferredoxin
MLGKLVGKVLDLATKSKEKAPARTPVTDSVPSTWNDATRPAVVREMAIGAAASVVFAPSGTRVEVKPGTSVLDAAQKAGLDLNHYCGGMASCGSCRVTGVEGPASPLDVMEEATLDVVKEHPSDRLGCQVRVLGEVRVTIPPQD